MKAKQVAKNLESIVVSLVSKAKLKTDEEHRALYRRFMKQYVGEAFEMACKESVEKRFKGQVLDVNRDRVIKELRVWGISLANETGVAPIADGLFDNVAMGVIKAHNKTHASTMKDRTAMLKKDIREIMESMPDRETRHKYMNQKPLTLAEMFGQ